MSLLADSATVAVLVLAWDETTPAVRALVEATEATAPAVDSVVVLVPAGPATDELTPEEFLPLANPFLPAEASALAAESPQAAAPAEASVPLIPATEAALVVSPLAAATSPATIPSAATAAGLSQPPLAAAEAVGLHALTAADLPGSAVRILRLSEHSLATLAAYAQQALPAPTWLGSAEAPTAPYLGSTARADVVTITQPASTPAVSVPAPLLAPPSIAPTLVESAAPMLTSSATALSYLPAELPAAPDAEPDTLAEPDTDKLAFTSSASTTELSEEAADELAPAFTVDVSPVQAGWPEALAALQEPAALGQTDRPVTALAQSSATSTVEPVLPAAAPTQAALLPATSRFDAPNLNFQIIQYARFAVPLALAAQPFAVIYAPAWPTWLAAQELRQRTGRPLVLHITTLAAQDEPLDLAAGWPAEIQRQALHRADLILTETLALALRLRRELALPAHRVRPVPAADADAIAQALSTMQAS